MPASPYSAEEAERITGVKAEDIKLLTCGMRKLSRRNSGRGRERYPNGGQAVRAIDCLPALTGAHGVSGRWWAATDARVFQYVLTYCRDRNGSVMIHGDQSGKSCRCAGG